MTDHSTNSTSHEVATITTDEVEPTIPSVAIASPSNELTTPSTSDDIDPESQQPQKKLPTELQDQTNYLPFKQLLIVMLGMNTALLCSILDQTIVSTALPSIGQSLGRADIVSWVGTSYLLTSTAFLPLYGRLSDIFGRKICLLVGLGIFLVGSILCATAKTMITLIVFRALAGIGGGGITNLVFIIISDVVSLKDRGKYTGIVSAINLIGIGLGPILGGVFSESVTWRWCFYINIPLTAFSIAVIIIFVPLKHVSGSMSTKLKQIDYLGSFLVLAWTIPLLIALSWGGVQYPWGSAASLVPLLLGVALLGIFIIVEWKFVKLPIIPMYIFNDRTVTSALISTFLGAIILYGNIYYLPQYFQVVKQDSPIRSGVLLLPTVLCNSVSVVISGYIVSKTGDYKTVTWVGYAILTIGQGLTTTAVGVNTSEAKIIGYQVLSSLGSGFTTQSMLVAIQAAVERKNMAVASATRNLSRQLGGTIAICICSTILNNTFRSSLTSAGISKEIIDTIQNDPTVIGKLGLTGEEVLDALEGYSKGIQNVFYLLTAASGISCIVTAFFLKKIPLSRSDDAERKGAAKAEVKAKKELKKAKAGGVKSTPADAKDNGDIELNNKEQRNV